VNRIPTLDGWRCIAIALVLADHFQTGILGTDKSAPVGQHGVGLFFVLSGYLITSKLMAESEAKGRIEVTNFYARRFMRLMPVALAYLGFAYFAFRKTQMAISVPEIVSCLLFYRNCVGLHWAYMTGHFWSLSLEEQFYLVWPPLLARFGSRKAGYCAAAAALAVAIFRFSQRDALSSVPLQATFGARFRADGLLIGCLAAIVLPRLNRHLRPWHSIPLLGVFAVGCLAYSRLIPIWESAAIAGLIHITALFPSSRLSTILDWKTLAWLGQMSYSIYIWQQPLTLVPLSTGFEVGLRVFLLLGVAFTSFYCLERPLVRLGRRIWPTEAIQAACTIPSAPASTLHHRYLKKTR